MPYRSSLPTWPMNKTVEYTTVNSSTVLAAPLTNIDFFDPMRVAVLLLLATPCNARRNGGGNVDLGGLAGLFGALVSGVPWGRNMCGRRFRSIGVRGEPLARQGGRGMVHLLYPPTPVPARHPGLMHKARRTNSWLECSECTHWDKQFCTSSEPPPPHCRVAAAKRQ